MIDLIMTQLIKEITIVKILNISMRLRKQEEKIKWIQPMKEMDCGIIYNDKVKLK